MLMVRLLCVIRMNWVCTLSSRTRSVKRAMLASSSGASTSSRMQNGLGVYWKMPTSRASAVSAFSPPESRSTFFNFLPRHLIDFANGGCGVFDGVEQVFALRSEELVALRRFLVFFESHHVD